MYFSLFFAKYQQYKRLLLLPPPLTAFVLQMDEKPQDPEE